MTTPSQSETDLLVPLGDHQHSTRVVLAHLVDASPLLDDYAYVRQSIDYAPFGRIVATLGANGAADAAGLVTPFAHHGSLLDAATGLQHKGERWYSPDLGRFVSEDPIQDGSNWRLLAANNPSTTMPIASISRPECACRLLPFFVFIPLCASAPLRETRIQSPSLAKNRTPKMTPSRPPKRIRQRRYRERPRHLLGSGRSRFLA